ncbi:MAG: DNA primase [Spirochaetes bacterium]|nr:DNA primase [Spirochaetota bacterium]
MGIPNSLIEQIRLRARIEDIVARYVPTLKKKGNNFTGLCPFHKEKTPSFIVSPDKQIFHCFGCHAGGNVFTFISKVENLSFPESVKFVGKLLGIDVSDGEASRDDDYYRINDFAMRLYQKYLYDDSGVIALDYLTERGVNEESIKNFRLGFAPDKWDFLKSALMKKKADLNKASEVSVLVKKTRDDGSVHFFDFFRNRVIFPITDRYGRVTAFGGRVIADGDPKYLNSPETVIYRKREMLYGYEQAKAEISSLKRAIIVEGYLDVIGCHQVGIKNVVAPLGTALTEEQVRFLSKSAEEIVLLFDADSAGFNASLRSIGVAKDVNVRVKVALLSEGDPFDFAVKKGTRELLLLIDSALDKDDFSIAYAVKDIKTKGVKHSVSNIFEIAKNISFDTERESFFKKAAPFLGTDYISLIRDFARLNSESRPKTIAAEKEDLAYIDRCYKELDELLINCPSLIAKAAFDFSENKPDSVYGSIFEKLVHVFSENENIESADIFNHFEGEEYNFISKSLSKKTINDDYDRSYNEIYLSMRTFIIRKKIDYYVALVAKEPSAEANLELESWKREERKLDDYLEKIRGTQPKSEMLGAF